MVKKLLLDISLYKTFATIIKATYSPCFLLVSDIHFFVYRTLHSYTALDSFLKRLILHLLASLAYAQMPTLLD